MVGVVTDVTSLESVEALRDATLEAFGAVHLVCNNAGIGSGSEGQIWEHHVNDWRWSLDVNVMGVVNGINAFVPTMLAQRRGGPRRQHDVGQRRVHAADQQRGVRDHEGRGHHHHRVPVGSAARGRRRRRRVAAVPVDAHAGDAQHRHLASRREPTRPLRPSGRAAAGRSRRAGRVPASAWTRPACRSCSHRCPRSPTCASRASATTCSGSRTRANRSRRRSGPGPTRRSPGPRPTTCSRPT